MMAAFSLASSLLTDKPGIPLIILHCQIEKVLFKPFYRIRLRLYGKRPLDLKIKFR